MGCYGDAAERKKLLSERAHGLNEFMKLPLEDKIKKSLTTISNALSNTKKPIISCSWGKDIIVLLHLVHRIDNSVPIIYNDTGVDFPETKEYMSMMIDEWNLDVVIAKNEKTSFWELVKRYGYPQPVRGAKGSKHREPICCKELKTNPTKKLITGGGYDLNFVGLRADEGMHRRGTYVTIW